MSITNTTAPNVKHAPDTVTPLPDGFAHAWAVHVEMGTIENHDRFVVLDTILTVLRADDEEQARAQYEQDVTTLTGRTPRPARVTLLSIALPQVALDAWTSEDEGEVTAFVDAATDQALEDGHVVDMWATHLP